MLADTPIIAFVPTVRPADARAFYVEVLGLRLLSEDQFAMAFDAGGTLLRVTRVPELQPPSFTVLGWQVPDIHAAVADLSARGVRFERFPSVPQDDQGVWVAPNGTGVAWFKDPDGNTLSLSQLADASA